MLRVTAPKLIP